MAQVVEHILGKDEVTSSNLVSSSKNPVHFSERDFIYCLFFCYCRIAENDYRIRFGYRKFKR